jgi:hypothetical protein
LNNQLQGAGHMLAPCRIECRAGREALPALGPAAIPSAMVCSRTPGAGALGPNPYKPAFGFLAPTGLGRHVVVLEVAGFRMHGR